MSEDRCSLIYKPIPLLVLVAKLDRSVGGEGNFFRMKRGSRKLENLRTVQSVLLMHCLSISLSGLSKGNLVWFYVWQSVRRER